MKRRETEKTTIKTRRKRETFRFGMKELEKKPDKSPDIHIESSNDDY